MIALLILFVFLALGVQTLIGLGFWLTSIREKEPRASLLGALQFAGMLGLLAAFLGFAHSGFFTTPSGTAALGCIAALITLAAWLLWHRTGANGSTLKGTAGLIAESVQRFDERQTVFARNRALHPGSEAYARFYAEHPESEALDASRREKGGTVGRPGAIDRPHERPNVALSQAAAAIPLALSAPERVTPRPGPDFGGQKVDLSPAEATERLKGFARSLGADLVGIAAVNPLWIYSHRGEIFNDNWVDWGTEIRLTHRYALVFAVEMSQELIAAAPHTPTSIASLVNYAQGAFIANLGYSATANHLRHYDALLVPLAVDAGLGELGRLGYLITRAFGPRVRLGAVTTDLPLVPDHPVDIGVEDFCRICRKCATCCPSDSIPADRRTVVNGTLRWKLNAETCFDYWGKIGTGCNICMRVCPGSHADTWPHRFVKALVARNRLNRRVFAFLDDVFYGKRPQPRDPPLWARFR
ncbi:MAG: hypothetical protein MUP74_04320 [Desulfobacterales bacterium]|nr:hypothetical protein [Desulfobacterales bacterium]